MLLRCAETGSTSHEKGGRLARWIMITRRKNPLIEVLWKIVEELRDISASVHDIAETMKSKHFHLEGGMFMYIIAADHADVAYHIVEPTVTDSEGHPVPTSALTFEIASDNPGAVEVIPTDQLNGTVHFGGVTAGQEPTIANVTVQVKNAAGTLFGSFGAQFTVTPGDPAAIAGGAITFDGLTEV